MARIAAIVAAAAALLVLPSVAGAAPSAVFDGAVPCTTQGPGQYEGQTWCGTGDYIEAVGTRSTVKSFDGVPIDVNFALPDPATSPWGDGPYPLVYVFHGYGQGKFGFTDLPGRLSLQHWLAKGYAVFSQSNRGFFNSCGTPGSKAADPKCVSDGWVRLDDTRYEVRDAQLFAGMLVDEGLVLPTKIAATGNSYGGGMSMALAALKDRTMMPDGTLVPWKSPDGTPMSLAVAAPFAPWTDLAYSLVPNGSNLDYLRDSAYTGRFGVMKQSIVNGLYMSGSLGAYGNYAPAGTVPNGDLIGWMDLLNQGEPYDGKPAVAAMLEEILTHHSPYYIDHSQPPAPLLIGAGFNDDIFPTGEATRFFNRTRAEYPGAQIGLLFGSAGHQRGQNKAGVMAAWGELTNRWVDHYLTGNGPSPRSEVTTFTQTCPDPAPDAGPFTTGDWASQSPGEIRLMDPATQTVKSWGGTRIVSTAFNPISGKACDAPAGAKEPGTANYELDPAPAGGYTMMGSPTVVARIEAPGDSSQIAARLVDLPPDGATKTLIARALWRPESTGLQVFQLNANGWKVEAGHVLRLELLPADNGGAAGNDLGNFSRPSNGQQPVTVSGLDLRIPVRETPGSLDGLVTKPAPRVLPDRPGAALAPGNGKIGAVTLATYTTGQVSLGGKVAVKGKMLTARFNCAAPQSGAASCRTVSVLFKGSPKGKKAKGRNVKLAAGTVRLKAGQTKVVKMKLTVSARKLFRDTRKTRGLKSLRTRVTIGGKSAGYITVKRAGRVR